VARPNPLQSGRRAPENRMPLLQQVQQPICAECGRANQPQAWFCAFCGARLASNRPTPEDNLWLAKVILTGPEEPLFNELPIAKIPGPAGPLFAPPETGVRSPWKQKVAKWLGKYQEEAMDHSQIETANLFGGRYEILARAEQWSVEVRDHKPWKRCWACRSEENEDGERFCTNCGAELEPRQYSGVLAPDGTPSGLLLTTTIEAEAARALLPPIWDQVQENGQTLLLANPTGVSPLKLPLEELAAMRVGLELARLLLFLHGQGLSLGDLVPSDLGITDLGKPRLLRVPFLSQLPEAPASPGSAASPGSDQALASSGSACRDDLRALAGLLEALTGTPRTTQRLENPESSIPTQPMVLPLPNEPTLAAILSQVRTGQIIAVAEVVQKLEALFTERTCPLQLTQTVGSCSDKGMIRDHNEDSLLALNLAMFNSATLRSWGLYVVADGMGGHAAGEVASGLAVRGVAEVVMRDYLGFATALDAIYDQEQMRRLVRRSVEQANENVRNEGLARGNDMGTTLTMALIVGDRATIANVGDSRTYLYRAGKLRRISRDHSLVMRLVELGQISDQDIYTHPQRNAVLRSLGDQLDVQIDVFSERLQPGDALLLCSDGQWEMTRDPKMEAILKSFPAPQEACEELIKAANKAGGEDNVTSILVYLAEK